MPSSDLPDYCIVLADLRLGQKWSQADLAAAAGFSHTLISDYERGKRTLTRSRLEFLIGLMGLPSERIEATLAWLAENRASSRTPAPPDDSFSRARRRADQVTTRITGLTQRFVRGVLGIVSTESEGLFARQEADRLWARLKRRPPAERRVMVEELREFQTWALCERVAIESVALVANHPKDALEMAELALRIAERVPGEQAWRERLQGLCWGMIANAQRVLERLRTANDVLAKAKKLWEAGAPADPGLLNAAWLPWIEANLRRDQRHFPQALRKIEEALALDDGELRGKILISKANILKILGEPEASTAVLEQAAPLIDATREPRLTFGLQFSFLEDLCNLGRAAEAAPSLPGVRRLAEGLGEALDLVKVVWLEGKVAAGLGKTVEALAAFEQARQEFRSLPLYLLYALVSLDQAVLLLEHDRTAEVREIAEEMVFLFNAQGVQREMLAALRVFCNAAKRQAATVEKTRRIIFFLRRAELDPELKFEEQEEAEAP